MRCPKCHVDTPPEALSCPGCNLQTPRGKVVAAEDKEKKQKDKEKNSFRATLKPAAKASSSSRANSSKASSSASTSFDIKSMLPKGGRWVSWLVAVVLMAGSGFGAYWYVYSAPPEQDAKSALAAMNQLRKLPSKAEGKTIDEAINAALKQSKDSGELLSYQGWTVKPFNKSSYLVSFTFEEKSGKKTAEWVVSTTDNSFIPHSELAMNIHKNSPSQSNQ